MQSYDDDYNPWVNYRWDADRHWRATCACGPPSCLSLAYLISWLEILTVSFEERRSHYASLRDQ